MSSIFYAEGGSELSMPDLSTISTGRIFFLSTGAGSVLNLPDLTSMTCDQTNDSMVSVSAGGTVLDPVLTTLNRTDLGVDDTTDTISTAQITSLINNNDYAYDGAVINLPGVTTLAGATYDTTIAPTGTSGPNGTGTPSTIIFPNLTNLTGATDDNALYLYPQSGGELSLPDLASISTGRIFFFSTGAGSVLNFPKLTSIGNDQTNDSLLSVSNGGTILDPVLTTLNRADLDVDGIGTISTAQITSLINNGDYASAGGILNLPGVTTLVGGTYGATIEASGSNGTGTPSTISLPNLTNLTGGTNNSLLYLEAESGGELTLPDVSTIPSGRVFLYSNGAGSVLNLPDLTSIYDDQTDSSLFNITGGATVIDPNLTTFSNIYITTDPTATFTDPANQTFSFPSKTTTISTGTVLDQGDLNLGQNATLTIQGALTINGQGGLSLSSASTLDVSGNLLGTTTNAAAFNPLGTVVLDSGTSSSTQLLEAMSRDLGPNSGGFTNNFAYGTLEISSNTAVELVEDAANSPGNAPQALYVNDLIIEPGATLNLDGLHLYYNSEQNNGMIIAPGGAAVSGQVYDDANGSGTFQSGDPELSGVTVDLINTATNTLYSALTNTSGAFALSSVTAGTYTLSEVVPAGFAETQPTSPGNVYHHGRVGHVRPW
jgi:hypothetical protein